MRAQASSPIDDFSHVLAAGLGSTAEAADLLQATLSRLKSLEAAVRLEHRVADLLVHGWQPGHEFLFDAARDGFHWAEDGRHLLALGETDAVLQEALIEQQIFFSETPELLDRQLRLVRRLRDATPPSRTLRRDERPLLKVLLRRYPHWLTMVTPVSQIEHWLGGPQALQEALAAYQPSQFVEASEPALSAWRAFGILLFMAYMVWKYLG